MKKEKKLNSVRSHIAGFVTDLGRAKDPLLPVKASTTWKMMNENLEQIWIRLGQSEQNSDSFLSVIMLS